MDADLSSRVTRWLHTLRTDLFGRVLPFWCAHSIDTEHGGFFNNLDEDGAEYDTHKHVWLQARQCWMFARIANSYCDGDEEDGGDVKFTQLVQMYVEEARKDGFEGDVDPHVVTRSSLVRAARAGVDFLRKHAVREEDGTVYFCLSREGVPALMQRKPFAAAFMVLALHEVGRASNDSQLCAEALALFDRMLLWIRTPDALGKPSLPGMPAFSPLNVPMIVLNLIVELMPSSSAGNERAEFYASERQWCVEEIRKHVYAEKRVVLENVLEDGTPDVSCPAGRLVNPGHAIEAGWFLLDFATRFASPAESSELRAAALEMIEWSFEDGWDAGEGGLLYFRDVLGYSPTELEWSMKLWWPHNEAMVAFAKAFAATGDAKYFERFETVAEWAFAHLVDRKHGEWFGYADRNGRVTHRFKGGPYKGCFHVPRALLLCIQALETATTPPIAK